MPLGGLIAGGIGAVAGLFGGGKQKTVNSNYNSNQNTQNTIDQTNTQSGQTSNTSTPNLSPLQSAISQYFLPQVNAINNSANNTRGLEQGGLEAIGGANKGVQTQIQNSLASRGLSNSPAAGTALTQEALNTGNQQAQFESNLPQLQNQLRLQALQASTGAFGALPTGVTNTGTSSGTSNTTGTSTSNTQGSGSGQNVQFGNPLGGAASGFGAGFIGSGGVGSLLNAFGYGGKSPTGNPNDSTIYQNG